MKAKSNFIKKILAAGAVFSISSLMFAFETGGLITNETKFHHVDENGQKSDSLKLNQKNGISLWLRAPFTEDGSSYFTTEGSFKTEYDASKPEDSEKFILTADLNLFKVVFKNEAEAGTMLLSAGRFFFSDLSGLVLAQNADGAQFDFSSSVFGASIYGAYTGLLNKKNITILEDTNVSQEAVDAKKLYDPASKYVIGGLRLSAPYFAAGQTASLEGLGAFQLKDGDKYNRFYGTLSFSGPIVPSISLYYNLSSTLGIIKTENDTFKTNLTKASVSIYPDFKSASVSLNGVYASGNQGPLKGGFVGFTSQTAVESTKSAEYNSIAKGGLSASIKPVSNFLLTASGDLVLSTAARDEQKDIKMAGFQCSAGANWQVVSDVSLGANFIQYIATNDDVKVQIGDTRTQVKISASVAF